MTQFSADLPELAALAGLASIDPSRMADALNDPEHFFEHMSLGELGQLKGACDRLAALQGRMTASMDIFSAHAHGVLAGSRLTAE